VNASLINLPCRLKSSNSQLVQDIDAQHSVILTVAVTDKLTHDDMLNSAGDYKVLQEHSKVCMPVVRAINGSNLLIDPQITQPCREAIMVKCQNVLMIKIILLNVIM
jgi:hypothetical protein